MDLYGYCTDDPVNFMDRSGLAGSSEAGEDGEDEKDEDKQESASSRETGQIKDDPSFSGEFGDALLETAKGTGRALYKIGSLAVGATGEIAAETLDKAHKYFSPITHSDTREEAFKFVKNKIEGKEPSANAPVEMVKSTAKAAKESWNNMTEKEQARLERMDKASARLNSNGTLAEIAKESVHESLKGWANTYLDTPDKITPMAYLIKEIDKIQEK